MNILDRFGKIHLYRTVILKQYIYHGIYKRIENRTFRKIKKNVLDRFNSLGSF